VDTDERDRTPAEPEGGAADRGAGGGLITSSNGHHLDAAARSGGDAVPPTGRGRRRVPPGATRPEGADGGAPAGTVDFATVLIERVDDLPDIFGKIDTAASPRVALLVPRGNRELSTPLGMRRLLRHVERSGRDLVLVTRSRVLRVRAREEGLPAVSSLTRVSFSGRSRGLQLGWITLRPPAAGTLLALLLVAVTALLGGAMLFWYLPTARVTVYLPAETLDDVVEVTADTRATQVNGARAVVPAQRREVTLTRTLVGPATDSTLVPAEHAAVALVFANRTDRPVRVPKGTVVLATTGMPFTVGNDVDLPGRVGASGEAIALAQRPGTAGNVPRNTVTRIEDPALSRVVSVTNPAPGEKGADVRQPVVSEADVQLLREAAAAYLLDAARRELVAQQAPADMVFTEGARLAIGECAPVPPVGQIARYIELTCSAQASLLVVAGADLRQVFIERLRPRLAADRMVLANTFRTAVDQAGQFDAALDRLTVPVHVTVSTVPVVDRAALRRALAGKTREGAERVVRQRLHPPLPAQVDLPGWAPWLPRVTGRIELVLKPAPGSP
jgi:hypothetical protein